MCLKALLHKELSWWLREKPTRECKNVGTPYIYAIYYTYREDEQDEEVYDDIRIRENGGEWREPLVEDHYKD